MTELTGLNVQDLIDSFEEVDQVGLCLVNKKGLILSANTMATTILNVDMLQGHLLSRLFPTYNSQDFLAEHLDFLEQGTPHPLQTIDLDFRVSLVRCEIGSEKGVLLLMQEEQSERMTNDYWSKIALRSLDEAIVITDREGLVQYLNEGAERLLKISKREAEGKEINKVMWLLDAETELSTSIPLEKVLEGSQFTAGGTHLLLNHQGQKLSISEFITPWRDAMGNTKGMVIAFRERRRTVEPPMRGLIEDFEDAVTLLQTLSTVKRDGALTLSHDVSSYTFYLLHGRLVHFEHKEFDQTTALVQVSKLKKGSFTFDPGLHPIEQTMNVDLMSLMIDVARHMDEVKKTKFESLMGKA
jgi:PAS domain S-box-containing protein